MATPSPGRRRRRPILAVAGLLAVVLLAALGATVLADQHARRAAAVRGAGAAAPVCADAVASTAGHLAARVYANDAGGANAHYSMGRVGGSRALGAAVAAGDGARAQRVMRGLLARQITRMRVYRGRRLVAEVGSGPAVAPISGPIRGPGGRVVGHYVLAIQNATGFMGLSREMVRADVVVRTGARTLAATRKDLPATLPDRGPVALPGGSYAAYSIPIAVFDGRSARATFLVSPSLAAGLCAPTRERTVLRVISVAGRRIYDGEVSSPQTRAASALLAHDPVMAAAVRAGDRAAVRAEIVRLFRTSVHYVRIRVTRPGGAKLVDLGGPAVLAPVHGALRQGGRVVGHFEFSLQDDAGYLKLVQRFTGADVLLRGAGGQVAGTLSPGPPTVPAEGTVGYGGTSYEAFSFPATAFPSGRLRVSILVRPQLYL